MNLPPESAAFFRSMPPVIIAFLVIIIFTNIKLFQGNVKLVLLASSLNALRMFLFMFALLHTSIANAIIILYTYPLFTMIYSHILLKESLSKKEILCGIGSFLGIITIFANQELSINNDDVLGISAMLLHSLIYPLTVIIFKKESEKYTNWEKILYQNLFAAIIFMPFIFINTPLPSIEQTLIGISCGLTVGLLGFLLFFSGLSKIQASKASLLCYMEVPSAIILGIIFLNETISLNIIIGATLIIGFSLFLQNNKKEK